MPIITVDMYEGRTPDQKRALVRELTDAFVRTAGLTPEAVQVILRESPKANWAIGGRLATDRDPT